MTDVGSYTFLDDSCAVRVPAPLRKYQPATMPLGTFGQETTAELVTAAMSKAIEDLPRLREGIAQKTFKSWADICDGFLEDLLQVKN